jgi:hypothetical protein
VSFFDSINNDGSEPPYLQDVYSLTTTTNPPSPLLKQNVWVNSLLNLSVLNIDSDVNSGQLEEFNVNNEKNRLKMCKFIRYVPENILFGLKRDQPCNCLIYLIYKPKSFHASSRWEYKTPYCYRSAIDGFGLKKTYDKIEAEETHCELETLKSFCFPLVTTTTTTTTTQPTTTVTTTEKPTTKRRWRTENPEVITFFIRPKKKKKTS